jgi:hypothetical protein
VNTKAPKVFGARYDGWCSLCRSGISKGVMICADCQGGWAHATCYRKANPPGAPPPPVDDDDDDDGTLYGRRGSRPGPRPVSKPATPCAPYEVFTNLPPDCTRETIRSLYRQGALACHPDRCRIHGLPVAVAEAAFKRLTSLYVMLERKYAKAS